MVKVWTGSSEQVLTMSGHQTAIMTITAATVLLMSGGAAWAAQHYGMIGVAVATASVMILQNIVMLLVVRKKTGVWTYARLSGLLFTVRPKR
jgi:O-antigen/teichoic acid export membrane protein